jgi:hypothetical protein
MINYIEKGIGLHEHLNMLGLGISQVDGVWQSVNGASHDDINAAIAAYVAPVPDLTPRQWRVLLGLIDVADKIQSVLAQVKAADRVQYAHLYAAIYGSEYYEYGVAVNLFASIKPVFISIDDQLDLSDAAIKDAWLIAAES